MTPDLPFWLGLTGGLAIEITFIALGAALLERTRLGSRQGDRLWKAAVLAMVLVGVGELVGVREGVRRWLPEQTEIPSRALTVRQASRVPEATTPADQPTDPTTTQEPLRSAAWWPGTIWLTGALLFSIRILVGRLYLGHRRRRAVAAHGDLLLRANGVAARLGLQNAPIFLWEGIQGPFAFGVWRRGIALPRDFSERFSGPQQEAMLAHELAHLAARDPAWKLLSDLVAAFAWWHPLAWWTRRRLQVAMERQADLASSLLPEGPVALAESLVALAGRLTAPALFRGLGMAGAGGRSELAHRVDRLLNRSGHWSRPSARGILPSVFLAHFVAGGLLAMAWPGDPDNSLRSLIRTTAASPQEAPARQPTPATPTPTSRAFAPEPVNSGPAEPSREPPKADSDEILLEVKVLSLEDRGDDDLGLDWLFGQAPEDDVPVTIEAPTAGLPGAGSANTNNIRIETRRIAGQVARLSDAQMRALVKRFDARGGAELLSAPKVQTRSGIQAQVAIVDSPSIVTGVQGQSGEGTNAVGINYTAEALPLGLTVDVLPWKTNGTWSILTIGRVTEFLGYDDPGPASFQLPDGTRTEVAFLRPLPRLRARETTAIGAVIPGETLLLRGPVGTETIREKRGWLRKDRLITQRRRLYVFVTPLPPR